MELLIVAVVASFIVLAGAASVMALAALKFLFMPIGDPWCARCPRCNAQVNQQCLDQHTQCEVLPHAERYAEWIKSLRDGESLSTGH